MPAAAGEAGMRIGLFGGTFDPVHNGHTQIARAFADELALDTVIFLPAGDPYHKNAPRTPAEHRLAMTQLAVRDDARFAVSDCDIVRSGATYTVDTVQIFRQQFPQAQLWWLMGMDSLLQLHTWKNWQMLVRQTRIAVAARGESSLSAVPSELRNWLGGALENGTLHLLQTPLYPVSSSEIRGRLKSGPAADEWLDAAVADYIRCHGLYRG
ncbi:nicotinate (nicotinamide) nucleotide adenylyltransferase [Neisseria leonii]|uniref:nicotinate (nicotinamide) nucleotide adenylyltransferase n=1 Tax=Neisseria leonii TaxID=2995413 RepID=UPI0030CC1E93